MNAQRRQSIHEDRRQEMKRKEREREGTRAQVILYGQRAESRRLERGRLEAGGHAGFGCILR